MPVTGIGGFFFRSDDPKALSAWYKEHFGIGGYDWQQAAGTTVFSPFPGGHRLLPGGEAVDAEPPRLRT